MYESGDSDNVVATSGEDSDGGGVVVVVVVVMVGVVTPHDKHVASM